MMAQAVFIHPRPAFLERIKKESEGKAITTPSMLEALKWITNPENHVSAIFLNPENPNFSALQFLELALNHRPTLPIFLLEGKLAQNKTNADKVGYNTNIRGIFSGSESYTTMISSLKINIETDENKPRATPLKQLYAGYVSIPVSDFFVGSTFPYNVFLPSETGEIRLFAQKDSSIESDYLKKLSQKTTWLLVKEEDIALSRAKIQEIKKNIATHPEIPTRWKSSEVIVSAKKLIEELRSSGIADNMVQHTQTMLGDLYALISQLDPTDDEGSLFDIIDRAKKCDRAVFCASYSILLCKQMRYERTATLEILGFASILQDVALYKTPYGDLSEKKPAEMSADELQHYLKHPVLSSDLVAQHTDLPQVTLQVIRQAHERRNKTGFPNKVGGSLLHVMAEILSLINAYYEVSKENMSQAELVEYLNRNVFPNFTDTIVMAFKQVLGNILKDKILADHAEQKLQ